MKRLIIFSAFSVLSLAWSAWFFSCSRPGEKQLALAYNLAFNGKYQRAVDAFEKALERLPRDAYYERTAAHKRAGEISRIFLRKYKRAIRHFKALSSMDSGQAGFEARVAIAEMLRYNLGETRQAIVELQNLVAAYPNHPDIAKWQLEIAKCYSELGDNRQARVEAALVLKTSPDTKYGQAAAVLMADSLYLEGDISGAAKEYEDFLEKYPNSELIPDAAFALAGCYEDMGKPELARTRLAEIASKLGEQGLIEEKIDRLRKRIRRMGR